MKITFDLKDCSWKLLKNMAQESKNSEDLRRLLEFDPVCTAAEKYALVEEIAANSYANRDILTEIYNQYGFNKNICYGLAKNPSVPREIIHELAKKCDFAMGNALIMNSALSTEDIDIIIEKFGNCRTIAEVAISHPNISLATSKKLVDMHEGIVQN